MPTNKQIARGLKIGLTADELDRIIAEEERAAPPANREPGMEVVAVRCTVEGCLHRNRIYPRAKYENPVSYCHGDGHAEQLVRLTDAQKAIEAARMEGVASVLTIRCVPHRNVAQLNRNEIDDGECGACVNEAAEARGLEVKVAEREVKR